MIDKSKWPKEITIHIHHNTATGRFEVSDDGKLFDDLDHVVLEYADDDASERHDHYVRQDPEVTIKVRNTKG